MTVDEKREQAEAIKWWHRMDLGDGVITNGPDPAEEKGKVWKLDEKLFKGKTVLDIGTWDGYFSFLAERLGAKEVTALDIGTKKGFDFAHKVYNSKVKFVIQNIMTSTPEELGTFDVVLYPGVLYHMKFPYLSLHKVAGLVKEGGKLFVETHTCMVPDNLSVMMFYPNRELANDPTNWWGPNNRCVKEMLETLNFKIDLHGNTGGDRFAYHATKMKVDEPKSCPANPMGIHKKL
jgi:tRNA (mo5U34)-methyltransferase